jgi:hypothetical protein
MEYTILYELGWHAAPMFRDGTSRYGVRPSGVPLASHINTEKMEAGWRWANVDRGNPEYWVVCPHNGPPDIPEPLQLIIKNRIEYRVGKINERIVV